MADGPGFAVGQGITVGRSPATMTAGAGFIGAANGDQKHDACTSCHAVDGAITVSSDSVFERITSEEVWSCTTCKACDENCPVNIEILDKILDMRRYLSLMESDFPAELGKEVTEREPGDDEDEDDQGNLSLAAMEAALKPEVLAVEVGGRSIIDITEMTDDEALETMQISRRVVAAYDLPLRPPHGIAFDDVLPLFKRSEANERGADDFHGAEEMMEVLRTDYIKFARARGLTNRAVNFGHALKNTLVPVITITGLQIGSIIAFAIITETVFQWPGMGLLFLQAIEFADIPIMSTYLILIALFFVVINLIVDLLYHVVDPRLRLDRAVAAG